MSDETDWIVCDHCGGEGFSSHDCGEDSCCCPDPEPNVVCPICFGVGGWEPARALAGKDGPDGR